MSRDLNDLRPEVRPQVDAFLEQAKQDGIDLVVTCTLRSFEEQAALYAQGRTTPGRIVTRAQPGASAHNYGLAVDVVPIINGKPQWKAEDPVWDKVGEIGQTAGLKWYGAPGAPFVEFAHFELPEWKLVIQTQRT